MSYNTQKEKWTLNKLISHCVQEEDRLTQDMIDSTHLESTSRDKITNKKRKMDKRKKATVGTSQNKVQKKQDMVTICFFCKKASHVKKDCPKYANWHVKKGTLLNFIYFEVNLASVHKLTWWINTGATTRVSLPM